MIKRKIKLLFIGFVGVVFSNLLVAQECVTDSIIATTPDSQFIVNNDGTVSDKKTGLMWKQCSEGLSGLNCDTGTSEKLNWQQALQRPQNLNAGGGFAGYNDWRLPNAKELFSIVEEQCAFPSINSNIFPGTVNNIYWTSTPESRDGSVSTSLVVHFTGGNILAEQRTWSLYLRLVRN